MLAFLPLVLCLGDDLASLEARSAALGNDNSQAAWAVRKELREGVLKLIEEDKLATGDDFFRAAGLFQPAAMDFEATQTRYELYLTSFMLGEEKALPRLRSAWDVSLISTGQKQRLGSVKGPPNTREESLVPDWAAKVVRDTLERPDVARASAKRAKNDRETQAIVEADQAARQGDFFKKSEKELLEMVKSDRQRLRRVKQLVEQGRPKTADDFANAALVMQHGNSPADFAAAHELCLCAITLDKQHKLARWLAAASYDRWLNHCGHRQRFGTQYGVDGVNPVNTLGINDTMRKALGCPTLEEARKRVLK